MAVEDIIEQNKRLVEAAYGGGGPTTTPRLSPPKPLRPVPSVAQTGVAKKRGEDKGILGGIASIVPSAIGGIGAGIAAIPQFGGKILQTAGGFVEGGIDLAADLINEDLYKSRFETDLEKGRELGLEGDELVAYASQRQYPLGSMVISGVMGTGRRLAELGTAGWYDYGDPGIDYAKAFREGNLGRLLVEDVGNVVLVGRAAGLGNVVSKAGASLAETGSPRLGSAVSTIGRAVEEPIAESVRQTGRLGGAVASRLDMPKTAAALQSLYRTPGMQAVTARPIRQAVGVLGDTWSKRAFSAADELYKRAAEATEKARLATDKETQQKFANEAADYARRAQEKIVGSGLVAKGRRKVWQMTVVSERANQIIASQFQRAAEKGAVPESPVEMRNIADRLRKKAAKETLSPEQTKQIEATALELERRAAVKEANPEYFDQPLQDWVAQAAPLIHIGHGRFAEYLHRLGFDDETIATFLQSPEVTPTLEGKSMGITPEGVKAAREYVAYMDGNLDAMNEGAALAIQAYLELYQAFDENFTNMVRRGVGIPTGPLPATYFSFFPEPKFLLEGLKRWGDAASSEAKRILDYLTAEAIFEMVRQGRATPEEFAAIGFDFNKLLAAMDKADPTLPESNPFNGYFERMVAAGPNTLGYQVAALVSENAYSVLRKNFPEQMMDKTLYPAPMRPTVEAAGRVVRAATADDVKVMAGQLADLVDQFETEIPKQIVEGALRDIEKIAKPGVAVSKKTWQRMLNRLDTILRTAERQLANLGEARLGAEADLVKVRAEMDNAIAALTQAKGFIENVVGVSRKYDLPEPLVQAQATRETAEAAVTTTRDEIAELQAELDDLTAGLPESVATPRREIDTLTEAVDDLVRERKQIEDDMYQADSLDEAGLDALKTERDFVARAEAAGEVVIPDPTPQQLKEARARAIADEEAKVREAESQLEAVYNGRTPSPDARIRFTTPEYTTVTIETPEGTRKVRRKVAGPARKVYENVRLNRESFDVEDITSQFENGMAKAGVSPGESAKLLKKFKDEFTQSTKDVRSARLLDVDQVAEAAAETPGLMVGGRTAADATPEAGYFEALGEAYGRYEVAKRRLAQTRRLKPDDFFDDARLNLEQELNPLAAPELSGFSSEQLSRIIRLAEDEGAMTAALDKVIALDQQINTTLQNIADLRENPIITARERTPEEIAVLSKISARQSRLVGENAKLAKARAKEVIEIRRHIKEGGRRAVRARLKGVGRLVGDQPVLLKPIERKLNDTSEQLINKEKNRQNKIAEIKERELAKGEVVEAAGEAVSFPRSREDYTGRPGEGSDFLIGPELFDPARDAIGYFPAGPTRGMLPRSELQTQIIGEGAGAQNEPSFARMRRGTSIVLTPGDAVAKMMEVTGQLYHNETVEMILRDPTITSSVEKILGAEFLDRARQEAEKAVLEQKTTTLRTVEEIDQAIQSEFGTRVIRELQSRGYEPVSRVEVDPNTGTHAAVGALDQPVTVANITPETFVMRQGVRERLFSQYVKKGARDIPLAIEKWFAKVGKATSKWKSVILPLSLRWQIGDAVSNVLNAWVRGDIKPRELIAQMRQVSERLRNPGDASLRQLMFGDVLSQATVDPVISAILGFGLQGRGLKAEEMLFASQNADKLLASIQDPIARTKVGEYFNRYRARAFRFNEAQNTIARTAVALIKLEENLAKVGRSLDEVTGVNALKDPQIQKALSDAVDATNSALGAFSDLSPWEKSVLRQIFPFWSWIKFINKAAIELAIDSPDRVLFYAHLGSMASDPDQNGFLDFLRGKTPVGPWLMDLTFMNPYSDALLLSGNPLTASAEQFTSLSPAITFPLQAVGEGIYGATGREFPLLSSVSRPGYLEGRPGATTRDLGDVLGGIGYLGLKSFGGPFRNVLEVLPSGKVPGTDVATGPGQRYPQGSLRTTGMYAEPRLSPATQRLSAILRTFGVPAPISDIDTAQRQAKEQQKKDREARLRRIKERQQAGS